MGYCWRCIVASDTSWNNFPGTFVYALTFRKSLWLWHHRRTSIPFMIFCVCSSDTWSYRMLFIYDVCICVSAKQCPPLSINGTVSPHVSTSDNTFGSEIVLTCPQGMLMQNGLKTQRILCLSTGKWSSVITGCSGKTKRDSLMIKWNLTKSIV